MPSLNGELLARKVISFEQLGRFAVLSTRQIQRLVKDGIVPLARDKNGRRLRGRVIVGEALPRLFEYAREHASGNPDVARFRAARAQREEADAEMATIELGYQRQKYLLASAVEAEAIFMLTAMRNRALAIPSRVTRQVLGLLLNNEPPEFKTVYLIIEGLVHEALNEMSRFSEVGRRAVAEKAKEWETEYQDAQTTMECETELASLAK